jgi:hypothetical protein
MIAMISSATSISISVKPPAGAALLRFTASPRMNH